MSDENEEKPTRKRLNLEFSPQAHADLQRMVKDTDASSNVEVIRDALGLYRFLFDQFRQGWSIQLARGTERKELVVTTFRIGSNVKVSTRG